MVRYFPSQGLKHSVVYGSLKFSPHAELITSLFHHLFPTGHEQENVGHGNIAQFNSNTFLGIFFKVKCIKHTKKFNGGGSYNRRYFSLDNF